MKPAEEAADKCCIAAIEAAVELNSQMLHELKGQQGVIISALGHNVFVSIIQTAIDKATKKYKEALEQYADPKNWGYYDDSGCPKGEGEVEEACFIGTEVARKALGEVNGKSV